MVGCIDKNHQCTFLKEPHVPKNCFTEPTVVIPPDASYESLTARYTQYNPFPLNKM